MFSGDTVPKIKKMLWRFPLNLMVIVRLKYLSGCGIRHLAPILQCSSDESSSDANDEATLKKLSLDRSQSKVPSPSMSLANASSGFLSILNTELSLQRTGFSASKAPKNLRTMSYIVFGFQNRGKYHARSRKFSLVTADQEKFVRKIHRRSYAISI